MAQWCWLAVGALLAVSEAKAADCGDETGQTEMNLCAASQLEAADVALNATYRQAVQRLGGGEGEKLLRGAQRAWLGFRDQHCAFMVSGVVGGSMQPFILYGCLQELTLERTKQLEPLLHCEEGDLSCPVPPG